ncbi:MAG: hypothetical protein M1831_003785 [Alyxoria varia]|nr:MAG: hypothetical protein M1831_003785 [Alyxoria varia]
MPAPVDWSWGEAIDVKPFNETSFATNNNPLLQTLDQKPTGPALDCTNVSASSVVPTTAQPTAGQVSMGRPEAIMRESFQLKRTNSMAGRKRPCGEISDEDATPRTTSSSSGCASSSPNKTMGEPIYGPGMTLMYPNDSSGAWEAGSQTGTWAEELAERLQASHIPESQDRPKLCESRKSIRLDHAASASELDDVRKEMAASRSKESDAYPSFPALKTGATHDEASIALGVGWTTIPLTETMLAAARGWARYIETAYPLRSVKLVWRNEGLSALLASGVSETSSPGYYLFDEDLSQGRLVAKSWERCLDNLRSQPYGFDGQNVMRAEEHRPVAVNLEMEMGELPASTSPAPPVSQEIAMEVD